MTSKHKYLFLFCFILLSVAARGQDESRFISFVADPAFIRFYWKDDEGRILKSIGNLKSYVGRNNDVLRFAMNGGMYTRDNAPQGLYIEEGQRLNPLDTTSGAGNFYLKPNGVFYVTKDNKAVVCETNSFLDSGEVKYATQSGPMLLIDGAMHPAFRKGSKNINIRNGVGILPDERVIFIMSTEEVNFYDFAEYFRSMHCRYALYLDGFVSRVYLPEKNWEQLDGNFGVMIGVIKP